MHPINDSLMTRTIPWLKEQPASKVLNARSKTQHLPASLSESDEDERIALRAQVKRRREAARRADRTPSTSPPPGPPAVEYMRDGFAHDDIYIMVEDEFLSTARLFTSHLHHAEYVRLKNAAKARANTASISRPTDSLTVMRAETKKKKEAESRCSTNKAALDKMMREARGGLSPSDSSGDFDSDEDADKTPWVGTSLQGLMAPDAKKNLTSLTGLQGIQSSTRAAKGLPKPEVELPRTSASLSKSAAFPSSSRHSADPSLKRRLVSADSSSASSDDLDARPLPRPHNLRPQSPPSKPEPLPNPLSLAAQDLFDSPKQKLPPRSKTKRHSPSPPPPRKRKVHFYPSNLDADADTDSSDGDNSLPRQSEAALRRLKARRERLAAAAAVEAKST